MRLASLVGAIPFLFAFMRGVSAGDWRYLWAALASSVGAALVLLVGKWRKRVPARGIVLFPSALALSTGLVCLTALVQGVSAGPAMFIVALAFGLCSTASVWTM